MRTSSPQTSRDGWTKATRAAPLWSIGAGKEIVRKVKLNGGLGRYFGEDGRALVGKNGEQFHLGGTSDVYRIGSPIADREESERPYEENVWVRAAIKAITEGFQRLRFKILDAKPENGGEPIEGYPLMDVLYSPNLVMTMQQFWTAHCIAMKHDGENIWFLLNAEGQPVKSEPVTRALLEMPATIIPVRGALVEIKNDANGMPMTYRYSTAATGQNKGSSAEFPVGSVVHFRDFDPYNITRGLGDVDALERECDLYFQAFRAMDGAVRNGGEPGGFIIYDHEVDSAEMQRRQELADDEFSGPNQRRIKLLQSSAKYVPNPVKPSDMQYQQLLGWLRDSILSGLGVPPPVVGVYDNATYNNVETAYRELWTGPNGIIALASLTADVITNDLIPRMARLTPGVNYACAYFDASSIEALQEDVAERLKVAADIAAKGVAVSFNEMATAQGVEMELPEEGDRKFIAGTLEEVQQPSADATAGAAAEIAADPKTTLNGAQITSLLSIVEQVTIGALPLDTAIQIIVASFPFDEARARRILGGVEVKEPEPEPAPAPEPPTEPEPRGGAEAEAPEDDDDEDDVEELALYVDQERLDEVYKSWRASVNMSASELEAWAENECSRKASLNPAAVIARNLNLLRKKKAEWTGREVKAANRAIAFIARMRKAQQGEPVGDCPSKRDISLRNWGFNPSKGSNALTCNGGGVDRQSGREEVAPVEQGEVEPAGIVGNGHDAAVAPHQYERNPGLEGYNPKLKKNVEKWLNAYAREQLAQLRKIANNGLRRFNVLDSSQNPAAMTDEAWDAVLLDEEEWAAKLDRATRVALRDIYAAAWGAAMEEVGASISVTSAPEVAEALAAQQIKLVEGVTSTLAQQVKDSMFRVLTKQAPPGTLREMIRDVLPELTESLTKTFGNKSSRAATIAQTETGKAQDTGKFIAYEKAGVETVQWISSNDDATRASHLAVHLTEVPLGQRFDNGLLYPHDPDGAAAEVINCRCTYIAKTIRPTEDDEDQDE